ncbi:probable dual specificity protein phosphatase DDB_G0283417 [Amyelois transitella]|uniref:probable dual specificity protein phosphatase DDB_G0283417 n=1 Tax=Amyelois transitella TaxID=680683 RepID=UPI00067AFFC2|nr:probable dual specificity protein phosphatase DDB_G0283417 [Amyelois transitella]
MSFLEELMKQKQKLKETETVVTSVDGQRHIEKGDTKTVSNLSRSYGFVVDTKPDNVPIEIVDYLYIGSQDCTEKSVLDAYNIKHVLSVGINVDVTVDQKFVECLDLPETDVTSVLNDSLPFIHKGISERENVLVHCNAGVSRTSLVTIGYLMHYYNMIYDEAYRVVKEKRPAIQPNAGFRKQLMNLKAGNVLMNHLE